MRTRADLPGTEWRKSRRSSAGADCVETAVVETAVAETPAAWPVPGVPEVAEAPAVPVM